MDERHAERVRREAEAAAAPQQSLTDAEEAQMKLGIAALLLPVRGPTARRSGLPCPKAAVERKR